jgi:hypothetical protein
MALSFDGTNDKVEFGDIAVLDSGLTALSVLFWLKYTNPQLADQIVTKGNGSSNGFNIRNTNPSQRIVFGVGSGDHRVTLPDSDWHHWAMVYDGSQGTAANRIVPYQDGVPATIAASGGTIPTSIPDGGATQLNVGGMTVFTEMSIAHFFVYTGILTAAEVAQQMRSRRPIRTSDLLVWAPMEPEALF